MSKEEDRACAERHARDALAWIAERKITPSPESFEIAFNYVTGRHGELKRNIESVLHSGGKIDDYILTILHARYFRSRKIETAIAHTGEELSRKLAVAIGMLEEGGRAQAAFERELGAAAEALGSVQHDNSAVEGVIVSALDAAQRMTARSALVEEKLQTSAREMNALREQLEATRKESLTDPLTGIANRKGFDVALQREIEASIESGEPLALVICDIDHFRGFNDQWGHEAADQVLRAVATCLSRNVKGRDIAARLGGDQFAVILPKTYLKDASVLANQIRGDFAGSKLVKDSTGVELGRVTLSAGIAEHALSDSIAELLRRADACLLAAKQAGRNQVVNETDHHRLKSASTHAA